MTKRLFSAIVAVGLALCGAAATAGVGATAASAASTSGCSFNFSTPGNNSALVSSVSCTFKNTVAPRVYWYNNSSAATEYSSTGSYVQSLSSQVMKPSGKTFSRGSYVAGSL
ncbi:MAG: hypothetical protein LBH48_03855 [Bifidobacteriaceae bacterium]|jgi:hypothetical protein|nr:hypothetical protein [Bifidobacteriaceae bacterium]